MYGIRLSDDQKDQLQKLWQSFKGTKKYHNFTKEVKPHETAANRYMMDMQANNFLYVNTQTFKVTCREDQQALEFVHFYLKGQSFLYN